MGWCKRSGAVLWPHIRLLRLLSGDILTLFNVAQSPFLSVRIL